LEAADAMTTENIITTIVYGIIAIWVIVGLLALAAFERHASSCSAFRSVR
jgi:hypothetical protein